MQISDEFLNSAELSFKTKAIRNNNLSLFHKIDMIEIINYCKERKIRILGIDGFFLHAGNKIQPSMEHSIDFSSISYKHMSNDDVYSSATDFISKQDDSLVFEIITE